MKIMKKIKLNLELNEFELETLLTSLDDHIEDLIENQDDDGVTIDILEVIIDKIRENKNAK